MIIVAISDTHGAHEKIKVPDGDVLIHSGDFCRMGQPLEFREFVDWFASQDHPHKIFTCGNHDAPVAAFESYCRSAAKDLGIHFLLDEEVVIDGVKFYGSPWTPHFYDWHFMKNRGDELAEVWAKIPVDTDVLITHGPAYGHGDEVPGWHGLRRAGWIELLKRIKQVQPKVHFFGHIHEGYGRTVSDEMTTTFVNAAIMDGDYKPVNTPQIFTLDKQ
jgi:Icc-related predicted phosphoesterase